MDRGEYLSRMSPKVQYGGHGFSNVPPSHAIQLGGSLFIAYGMAYVRNEGSPLSLDGHDLATTGGARTIDV